MVAQRKKVYLPLETYFQEEERAEVKSEYHNGVLVAMAGASPAHIRITTVLTRIVGNPLEGGPCEPFDSDMRVFVEGCNTVYYPDLTVVCETPQFAETRPATLLNPALIIEVLSPSTERADRGVKFDCYRTLASLRTYVLVSQDEPRIELFRRQPDGSWRFDVVLGLDAVLELESIGCALPLAQIYSRVEFSTTSPGQTVSEAD